MKTTILPERLLDIVKTKEDANNLLFHIDAVISNLFKSSSKPIDVITAFMPYAKKEWSLSLIHEHDLNVTDLKQMQDFFQILKETLGKIPVVEIALAFEPTESFVSTLSGWFIVHCKKPVLMDIRFDPKVIAGAIIGYNGNYKDFSMGKILKEKQEKGELRVEVS